MKMRFALIVPAVLLASFSVAEADDRSPDGIEIRDFLHRCPDWETVGRNEDDRRLAITTIYQEMAIYQTVDVRAGVSLYLQECSKNSRDEFEAWSKIYAFYRVFFKIGDGYYPVDSGDKETPHDFQSILGCPRQNLDRINLLWPYSINRYGKLELQYVEFMGERTRDGYLPLRDFDDLMRRFGRRTDEAWSAGPNQSPEPVLASGTSPAVQEPR